jgi:hypothetical protein
MFRPPFDEVVRRHETAGGWLWYHIPGWRNRWLEGMFDKPLYALDEGEQVASGDTWDTAP